MPNKKLIISLEHLTNAIHEEGSSVEKVLSLLFRILQKNYAIASSEDFISFSQPGIESEMMESLVNILVKYLKELNTIEVIKITPLLAGELFEIEIQTPEVVNSNVIS